LHMRRICHRVLDGEGYSMDPEAVEALIEGNPGDLRALIRDLQAVCANSDKNIDLTTVKSLSEISERDSQIDVFKALREVYKSRSGKEANRILMNSDKDPDEMLAWFAWNNQSVFAGKTLSEISNAMLLADRALATKFTNRAYRSWYWGSVLTSQAAVSGDLKDPASDQYIAYPNFLRRGNEAWRTASVIEKMAENLGSSKASVREDLWPNILAVHDKELGGEPNNFSLAMRLNLSGEEHLALHGIPKSRKEAKIILKAFDDAVGNTIMDEVFEPQGKNENHIQKEESSPQTSDDTGTQFSLDSF